MPQPAYHQFRLQDAQDKALGDTNQSHTTFLALMVIGRVHDMLTATLGLHILSPMATPGIVEACDSVGVGAAACHGASDAPYLRKAWPPLYTHDVMCIAVLWHPKSFRINPCAL